MGKGVAWTDEDVERLKPLWANRENHIDWIAEQMGRNRNSVIGAVHRYGLPLRSVSTGPQKDRILKARNTSKLVKPRKRLNWGINHTNKLPPTVIEAEKREGGIPLMELRPHHCRAIIGSSDDYRGLATYCGDTAVEGTSWCNFHHARFFTKGFRP